MVKEFHCLFVPKSELFVTEVAVMLSCSSAKVYTLLKNGELKGHKEGKAWKISVDELYRYADRSHIPLSSIKPDGDSERIQDD